MLAIHADNEGFFFPIAATHKSIGGGVRLFLVLQGINRKYYTIYLRTALQRVDEIMGCAHDKHCDHLMRLSVASYDPDAWVRKVEECESFPYTEEEKQLIAKRIEAYEARQQANAVEDVDFKKMTFSKERNFTAEQILQKMEAYMEMCPYRKGNHHDSLLMGGAMAKCEGFTTADLAAMAQLIIKHFPVGGYNYHEVLLNLFGGYDRPALYAQAQRRAAQDDEDYADDDYEINLEVVEATCPYFSEEVIKNLPALITGLLMGLTKRQRDVAIASLMTTLSSVMANVTCPASKAIRPTSPSAW